MGIQDWSVTAADNITLEGVSWAEGMAPGSVNNGVRALAAAVRAGVGNKGTDIASASSIDLGAATGQFVDVTGTATITALGTVAAGTWRLVRFTGALTLTHNATSLILPGAANITTAANDLAAFVSLGSGNWVLAFYQRGSALSPVLAVTDFGAKGDGGADDGTALAAAITWRDAATGRALYWPAGNYLTTASIASLHGRNSGPGRITRGSDTFYIDPPSATRNHLYVATTGSDSNDGLTSSQPFLTVQAALNALKHYGPVLGGIWRVNVAAGTYTLASAITLSRLRSVERIEFYGATQGHPNVPTTILDCNAGAISGFLFTGLNVQVRDIKVTNSTAATGGGITAQTGCDLYTVNFHAENVTEAIRFASGGQLRVQGGIFTGSTNGTYGVVPIGGGTYTIGYNAASTSDGTQISGFSLYGVQPSESANGHIDYCTIESNGRGVGVFNGAHAHIKNSVIQNNTTSQIRCQNATFYNNGNTLTGTKPLEIEGSGGELIQSNGTLVEKLVYASLSLSAASSSTSQTVVSTPYTIPADYFNAAGKHLRVKVWGSKTGTGGGGWVALLLAGTEMYEVQLSGSTAQAFTFEFDVEATSASAQRATVEGGTHGLIPRVHAPAARGHAVSGTTAVQVAVRLGSGSDTMTVQGIKVWRAG